MMKQDSTRAQGRRTGAGSLLLAMLALVTLGGCATGHPLGSLSGSVGLHSRATSWRHDAGTWQSVDSPVTAETGSAGGFPEQTVDLFQAAQEASGLGEEARHPPGAALYQEQARELLGRLAKTRATPQSFAPRRLLFWLLREVLAGGERVEYADLKWRAERFGFLVMVRPDGYLVSALTGTPLQRMGPLELEQGEWKVGLLRVGDCYFSHGGVLYPVTEALRRADGPPLAELSLGRDPVNAALDGGQQALTEMAVALAGTIVHPIRTVEGLTQLPITVAVLIASSPEYFAHYGTLSHEDQIREAARLSTHVLALLGGAQATVGGITGLGAELPVVSLTAEGELVLGGVVVAEGTTATTVSVDLGALSVLHMAGKGQGKSSGASGKAGKPTPKASPRRPGQWTYKKPTTESQQALDFQEQITGRPAWYVYMIGAVEFDGFNGLELLEAKGASYKKFLTKVGTVQPWFEVGKGYKELMKQARRQSELAEHLGLPVVWHVAEEEFANFLRKLFERSKWKNIKVVHTPPTR
ncbi:MAG: Tox-REase-5 domain-containing protein [Hyalangium sp.]|uniref:Tox-REase-5 domain-containing protein n=1 Tax=Hyalangium sp. TaxID=2028555 RepID=UPI00389A5C84